VLVAHLVRLASAVVVLAASASFARAFDGDPRAADPVTPAAPAAPIASSARGARATLREVPGAVPARPTTASLTGTWMLPADLRDARGEVEIRRACLDVAGQFVVRPDFSITWGFDVERSRYTFTDPDRVVSGSGRLVGDGTVGSIAPGLSWAIDEAWRVDASVTIATSIVPGARMADAITYVVDGSATHRFASGIALTLGAEVSTVLDDNPFIFPIVMIGGGDTGPIRLAVRGTGVFVAYDVNERVAVGVSARYDHRDYRFSPSDRLANGVFRDQHIPIGLELDWKPSHDVTIGVSGGLDVYARMRLLNAQDNEVVDVEPKHAGWFGLLVSVEF
jgi:hypothetical protein